MIVNRIVCYVNFTLRYVSWALITFSWLPFACTVLVQSLRLTPGCKICMCKFIIAVRNFSVYDIYANYSSICDY